MSSTIETSSSIQDVKPEAVDVDDDVAAIDQNLETTTESLNLLSLSSSSTSAVAPIDLVAELQSVQERLEAIAKEERAGADAEKVALEELQKSTEGLIAIRKLLAEKKAQLDSLEESDNSSSSRQDAQAELDQLTKEANEKEHQWSATKEVCHREFGPIVEDTSAPRTEVKAKTEHDIKLLQDQIANLQKQLDAVSMRRKQMVADAEEQHKRLAEQGGAIDDDEEEDA